MLIIKPNISVDAFYNNKLLFTHITIAIMIDIATSEAV